MTPPLRFGPYELLEVVGGGMGIVHRARRVGDDRELAIKLMRQERLLDGEARARFLRELAAMRRLDHPAICPLLDAGEIDGMPFLCMPWIPGSCLDAVLRAARDRGDAALSLPGQARGLPGGRSSGCLPRLRMRCRWRTNTGSCIATSSRRTCASIRTASRCCSTSAWRAIPPIATAT